MATESGGTVYYKTTPLGALSFPTGKGAPFVQWPGASINDPSTSKHPVTAATGLVVLASDDDAHRYYHGELALDGSTTPPPDGQAPTQPTGLQVTATTASSVSLSWTASTDDTGVTGYRVFRGTTQVGTVTTTSYTDSGLAASTAYSYTVRAVDAAGNVSPASTAVTATTQSGTTTPPPAGTGFVGAATAAGTTTSTSVAAPAGAQTGDVLVAVVSTRGAPSIPTPAGWTAVRTDTVTTTMRQAVFVRALTSDTAASTWTLASAQPHVVQVLAFRGVSTTSPVVAAGGAASTSTAITAPSVAAAAGGPVVTFAGIARATTLTPPGGLTERSEIGTPSTARYQVTGETASGTASGATAGPFTTTAAGSAAGIGQTVTLRPAG
jgi:chitodextrinase